MDSAMRRAVLPFLLCCALGVSAWAEEDSESPDPSPAPNTGETDAEASRGAETAEEAKGEEDTESPDESPEIFIPSEDISESIAVKFPVDI